MLHMLLGRSYRLVYRGGAGLACDKDGVTLGAAELVRVLPDAGGRRRCSVRSPGELGEILKAAYGGQSDEAVLSLHRGLSRTARWIEADDHVRAGIEAVTLRLPDLTSTAVAKLAEMANLEKGGTGWQNQPRLPAGQSGGGEWTTGGGGGPAAAAPTQTSAAGPQTSLLDDGVYRPDVDHPALVPVGGPPEEEPPPRFGSNGPPEEFTTLRDVFPGFRDHPGLGIPLAPIDGFLGFSALTNEANLQATMLQYRGLIAQIKSINPQFHDAEILPPNGIAGLSFQGRNNLINHLRMERAAALYKFNGDARPLQVEVLRFLRASVDGAYSDGTHRYSANQLTARLSREEAFGNYMDKTVRFELREFLNRYGIPYGPRENITVNNRDYDTSSPPAKTFRIPDARIGNVSFDWTLSPKTIVNQQIRGFFNADSQPIGVVIVRPAQLGANSVYLILAQIN